MELVNYVSVDEVVEAVEEVGFKWVASRNISSHPDDWYLKVVYAYRESNAEWVVWLYNATTKGLYEGYYTKDNERARDKYLTKG
jgi:predicted methyltransferase